jgi:hypothetical protein
MGSAVFTMILLLLEPVGAIFDNVGASAHSTTVRFLNHVAYLTITYFSTTTPPLLYQLGFFTFASATRISSSFLR